VDRRGARPFPADFNSPAHEFAGAPTINHRQRSIHSSNRGCGSSFAGTRTSDLFTDRPASDLSPVQQRDTIMIDLTLCETTQQQQPRTENVVIGLGGDAEIPSDI